METEQVAEMTPRDMELANKRAFRVWLRESMDDAPRIWREAERELDEAKRLRTRMRAAARRAWKKKQQSHEE